MDISLSELSKFDLCLLIGINLRLESPLYNVRLKRLVDKKNLVVVVLSNSLNLGYSFKHVSLNPVVLFNILEGKHSLCSLLLKYKNTLIINGASILIRNDSFALLNLFNNLVKYVSTVRIGVLPLSGSNVLGMIVDLSIQ
jgi:hypothetical protein